MNTVILIGFMGAGKTTVGIALSKRGNLPLVDTDQRIIEKAGMSISEIFAQKGEDTFRQIESQVLSELLEQKTSMVVSVGGGLPLKEENRRMLKRMGTVVYLKVMPETVLERLKGDTTRPLLAGPDGKQKVGELLEKRGPIYQEAADLILSVDGKSVEEILGELEERIREQS